jgi:hypothetical protein
VCGLWFVVVKYSIVARILSQADSIASVTKGLSTTFRHRESIQRTKNGQEAMEATDRVITDLGVVLLVISYKGL